MSDIITIEGLPEIVSPSGSEFAHVSIGGVNYKIKLSNMGVVGAPDTTPPTVVSATCPNGAPTTIVVVFSESVTGVSATGWSFKKNGSAWSISSVSGSGTTWTFTMGSAASSGDTLLRSYNSATGATIDASSNELVTFTDSSVTNSVGGSYDTDAQAFFTAASITDATEKTVYNQLVLDLKGYGFYTSKIIALFPFLGGTSAKVRYDAITATQKGTIGGTVTINANGITGDGSTGYFDTGIVPSTDFAGANDCGFFAHVRNNVNGIAIDTFSSGAGRQVLSFAGGNVAHGVGGDSGGGSAAMATQSGIYVESRTATNSDKLFKAGSLINTVTTNGYGNSVYACQLLCEYGNTTRASFSSLNLGIFGFTKGLTDTEAGQLSTALAAFKTGLGR